jgi:hypothetical protein
MTDKNKATSDRGVPARAVVGRSPGAGQGKSKPAVDLDKAVPAGGDDEEATLAIVQQKDPPVPVWSNAEGVIEPLVNPEFATRIPPHSPEEKALLRRLIIEHRGVYEPVLVWEETNQLLDGFNRKGISDERGLPYPILYISLPDKNAAIALMCAKQRGRRNLTPVQAAYLQGSELLAIESRQGERTDLESGHDVQKLPRAEEIAQRFGVDERTIRRKSQFAKGLDYLAEKYDPNLRTKALACEIKGAQSVIEQIMKMRTDRQKERAVQQLVETGRLPRTGQQAAARTPLFRLRAAWDKADEDSRKEFIEAMAAESEFVGMLRALLGAEGEHEEEDDEDRDQAPEQDDEQEVSQLQDGEDQYGEGQDNDEPDDDEQDDDEQDDDEQDDDEQDDDEQDDDEPEEDEDDEAEDE